MSDAVFTLDQETIQSMITKAVEDKILSVVDRLINDENWLAKVESMINQTVLQQTIARVGLIDINTIIRDRVDENNAKFRQGLVGISDQASAPQLTIMDDTTVFENILTTRELNVVDGARINNLAVTGSINVDNPSWDELAKTISEKTLTSINDDWQQQLVSQVSEKIKTNGISFDDIKINDQSIINHNALNDSITASKLQSVGTLRNLRVSGPAHINNTISVVNGRLGVNTEVPDMALSVWDQEVSVSIGKFIANEAYIGTSRAQGIAIGVNRTPQLSISADGLTTIKKLKVGQHMVAHSLDVPGWSGTRGDMVFNANPKDDKVFAWVCLGAYKWQPLKSA